MRIEKKGKKSLKTQRIQWFGRTTLYTDISFKGKVSI